MASITTFTGSSVCSRTFPAYTTSKEQSVNGNLSSVTRMIRFGSRPFAAKSSRDASNELANPSVSLSVPYPSNRYFLIHVARFTPYPDPISSNFLPCGETKRSRISPLLSVRFWSTWSSAVSFRRCFATPSKNTPTEFSAKLRTDSGTTIRSEVIAGIIHLSRHDLLRHKSSTYSPPLS